LKDHGLKPRARIHHLTVRGDSPIMMLTAPIPATRHALAKTGLKLDDIDLVEINEAFASVVLGLGQGARRRSCPGSTSMAARSRSAIRWARPAPRLMTTLLYELERRNGAANGLQTMCEGRRPSPTSTIIERL